MGKAKGKHRLDKYYHLAKEHGYRSRAAWKLVQLDSKHGFLRSSRSVLDLCAAPGGWMQVAVERVPVGSLVIGVDLDPIRPVRGAIAVQEDITTTKCKATVKKLMAEHGSRAFDLILHDGSPNVGGAWSKEATSQNSLVIDSVKLVADLLAPKGTFVTKIFRSQDYSAVLFCLKQLFEKVEVDKPLASRSSSAEIYVIGLKYKAPAKIDPRLLDVKHLFEGGKEPRKVEDVLRGTKQKRHRDGYEDGDTTLRKVSSAADFMWSNAPLDILGSVTKLTFEDPASLVIKDHALTSEEIKALCDDLRVIGKQDFKYLLKWRMNMRKALSPATKDTPTSSEIQEEPKENEDERVLNELEELTNAMDKKKKKVKKIASKRRAKDKARKALGRQQDAIEDYVDLELFSLSSIKGKKDLVAVDNNEFDDEVGEEFESSDDEGRDGRSNDKESSDIDSDEERKRYDEQVEQLFDEAYEQYVSKKEGSTKQRKRARQGNDNEILDSVVDDDDDDARVDDKDQQPDKEVNPLVVPLEEDMPTQEEILQRWFTQDVFAEPDEDKNMVKFDSDDEMPLVKKKTTTVPVAVPSKPAVGTGLKKKSQKPSKAEAEAEGEMEIVPTVATDSDSDSSSDEDIDEDDIEKKAEILALAKKMLRKKQREEILDDAYNKHMFHDTGLPEWFVDEEKKHRQPMKPITKEEVNAMKAQFKEIDARPAKKVAQAKARKKRATHRKLEKVRKKANTISDMEDISDRSKGRMIESLYKKATPQKPKKEYVVAKKGVQVKAGKGKVLVDRRMKSDARTRGLKQQGKGKKGRKDKGNNKSGKKPGKFNNNNNKQGKGKRGK